MAGFLYVKKKGCKAEKLSYFASFWCNRNQPPPSPWELPQALPSSWDRWAVATIIAAAEPELASLLVASTFWESVRSPVVATPVVYSFLFFLPNFLKDLEFEEEEGLELCFRSFSSNFSDSWVFTKQGKRKHFLIFGSICDLFWSHPEKLVIKKSVFSFNCISFLIQLHLLILMIKRGFPASLF